MDPRGPEDFDEMARRLTANIRLDRTDLAQALFDYYSALKSAGFTPAQSFELVKTRGLDTGAPLVNIVMGTFGEDSNDWRDQL
jgi:hypothetical protein